MESIWANEHSFRLLFNESPSTLQEISSLEVALSLWNNVLFREKVKENGRRLRSGTGKTGGEIFNPLDEIFSIDVENLLKTLHIPGTIATLIDKSCKQVGKEMNDWKEYMCRTLPTVIFAMYRSHLKCCVWQANGTIDYKRSARKFISVTDIKKAGKFEIASHFCLEDVMIELLDTPDADLIRLVKNFTKKLDFDSKPLLYYWLCKLTSQQSKVPIDRASNSREVFILYRVEDEWSAEYFWERLNEQRQITAAVQLIRKDLSLGELRSKKLLAKMNDLQFNSVLSTIPVECIWVSTNLNNHEVTFLMWTHAKDWMNGEQFLNLVEKMIEQGDSDEYDHQSLYHWLLEIWNTASDRHKDCVLLQGGRLTTKHIFSRIDVENAYQFLYSILSYASKDYRQAFFLQYGYLLITLEGDHFDAVGKLMQLCLPDAKDVEEFKKAMIRSPHVLKFCEELFLCGEFKFLNKMAECYFPTATYMRYPLNRVVEWYRLKPGFKIIDLEIWSELNKFFNYVYLGELPAADAKAKFIWSYICYKSPSWMYKLQTNLETLTTEFMSKAAVTRFKHSLLERVRRRDPHSLKQKVLEWCIVDPQERENYKLRNFGVVGVRGLNLNSTESEMFPVVWGMF